jgi:hypothetical protein
MTGDVPAMKSLELHGNTKKKAAAYGCGLMG